MKESKFFQAVKLLVRVLPIVAKQKCFALKGGTAINLFYRNMPRLSVDIDLVYLPIEDRKSTLQNISSAMQEGHQEIERLIPGIKVREHRIRENRTITRLVVESGITEVKIEPNTILRGTVYPTEKLTTCDRVVEIFETSVTITNVSFADLYAGKICAALDRQHPRDLFDIKVLLEHEGITDEVRKAFVVYLVCHNRPMEELLQPNLLDQKQVFEAEFHTMTEEKVSYGELEDTRKRLISSINEALTDSERKFVLSVAEGEPDWSQLDFDHIAELPAVQWKLQNVRKMDRRKRETACMKLKQILEL